ncbi:MAG: substrate-binding domain-containing protein [Chitinophagaceae bacterium]
MPKRRTYLICCHILMLTFFAACTSKSTPKKYVIGFSQCVESDQWRKTMLEEMKRELSFHPDVNFIYMQADGNSQTQIGQVRELLQKNLDILIISPNEAEPLTPVVEETFKKHIPVIVVDRKIATPFYTAYVGGNNYEIGKLAGEYALQLLKPGSKILEITGLPKSSPAIERSKGFDDALKKNPDITIAGSLNGEWLKEKAKAALTKALDHYPGIDLVFAHNEMMALGTSEVFEEKHIINKPKIIGVDGLPGRGIEFVTNKQITATMLYPTGGEESIIIAFKILNGEKFEKENILQTTVIDSTNVRVMQLQAAKIGTQQQDIEQQDGKLREQKRMYNNQRTLLYFLVSALVLVIILGGLAFHSLRENRKINRRLELQNLEISEQKKRIEEISAKAKAANEAKVSFFTNISHEFRTPLTLILAPLEELLANPKSSLFSNSLVLIQKNVIRLLRLVNQLMDFRKIDVEKMKVRPAENDIVSFIAEIVSSYKTISLKRDIDLRLITKEGQVNVWFDSSMIDKVIFNLLSNAFKFTKDGGFIHVYVNKTEDGKEVSIKVEDNGVGMAKDGIEHAFDAFYQGEYENYKGSGLGLALSKELVQLHKGAITVRSEKWKGTTFEIRLLTGSAHFTHEELVESDTTPAVLYEHEKIYTSDLEGEQTIKKEISGGSKEHSILIVEDNPELRNFLANKLTAVYNILEADNGQSALQQAFDTIPDLIISDVVIPGKDGMALTNILKNDIRTSHIPIVLLTAKTSIDQQIEGMRNMADAYITKPFNIQFLEQNLKSLLANRARLKEHFTGDISSSLKTQTFGKLDKKFITEFTALIESNISNDEFNVDTICKLMGVSKVQLYRKVKALLNVNVNDYLVDSRLQKAKYFLQHEEFSISEIAYKVGFSSPAYFSTVFKSKFGVTPKAFKEK